MEMKPDVRLAILRHHLEAVVKTCLLQRSPRRKRRKVKDSELRVSSRKRRINTRKRRKDNDD
jgi:hypothetical protein